jgi:1-aminocyclopropane-1-carboxylate deaminase/D-cysteine desulfhydrase-like pyridoxal-dependent ACC family enzyme
LGGISIYVKRDDVTGLALGGNKARQLEFLLGEAVDARATAIITGAGVDSNHCRQLAAACARLGLRACLILRGECPARVEGNLLLDRIFGAECRFISTERFYAEFDDVASEWSNGLSMRGERPYVVNTLGRDTHSVAVAALGYVQGALELEEQFEALGWRPDVVYFCSGAATQAGFVLAQKCLDLPYRLVGISASAFIPDKPAVMAQIATRAARLLDLDLTFRAEDITNEDGYIGAAYGALTPASVAALRLAARTEGLLLDPTYTAKALAGLVDHLRQGRIRPDERVLFLHTGGAPALFLSRNEALADAMKTIDDDGLS